MDKGLQNEPSHLFLVRLWLGPKDGADGAGKLCEGKVQHLISGKAHSFSDWPSLVDLLSSMASASSLPQVAQPYVGTPSSGESDGSNVLDPGDAGPGEALTTC